MVLSGYLQEKSAKFILTKPGWKKIHGILIAREFKLVTGKIGKNGGKGKLKFKYIFRTCIIIIKIKIKNKKYKR